MKKLYEFKEIKEQKGMSGSGCLMIGCKIDMKPFHEMLDENDIYTEDGYGLENWPHCTVLYGFDESVNASDIMTYTKGKKLPENLILEGPTLFENEKFDVLKFDVKNKALHTLHDEIKENFPNEETFPEYKPHVTIAYLKPGTGKKYLEEMNSKLESNVISLKYSDGKGNEMLEDMMTNESCFYYSYNYGQTFYNREDTPRSNYGKMLDDSTDFDKKVYRKVKRFVDESAAKIFIAHNPDYYIIGTRHGFYYLSNDVRVELDPKDLEGKKY